MESPDIQAKYQKLAAEYSKLRAQNQVLKKAVVDEQGKTAQLNDFVKSRDQLLRKADQENDSLSFRNQQLTKRLTLLQEDLDEIQTKSKRGRGKGESVVDGAAVDNTVFTEELQLKIQENARLQSELSEIETTYRRRYSELETQLDTAKRETQKQKELFELREKSAQGAVEQLETERVRQEVVAQQREAELRALKEQVSRLESLNKAAVTNCQPPQTQEQGDKSDPHRAFEVVSRSLNIPVQNGRDRAPSVTARSLVDSFDNLIQVLSDTFAKFLCSYSTRVKLYDQSSEIQLKLIQHLRSAALPWHPLASSYHHLADSASGEGFVALETLSGLSQVSRHVTACGASLRKVLPLVVLWVSEGSRGQVDGDRAGAAWSAAFSRLVSSWGSLAPYVATLASQSTPNSNLPPSAQGRVISMLSDRLDNLHAALTEASNIYQKKALSEKVLPSTSGEAKAANEEIVNVLTALSVTTSKMSTLFKEQVVPSWNRGGSTPSTPSSPYPSMPYGLNKSTSNSASIAHDESNRTLYDGTLASPSDTSNVGDTEASLTKQLALASSKLSQLESEREHWRLEHQLLQCKHQKEAKRVRQLETQLQGDTVDSEDSEHLHFKDHSASNASTASIIGEVQGMDGASDEREKDIRNHFTSRCSHLYMQLTSTTSQAALYQNECESLMRRLVVSEENRASCDQEVDKQREIVNQLKETLQTTSRNYEEQISTMSEHLADLNEKITAQTELIEHLKYEAKNKRGKK
ncbi:protein phosphatase 1 regulatory subunit 21-like isoform X2 [Homarus americanus]|uniref:protein phosphatase 1 regulatory subunit 21-like isoform X2 n=1 Tax=Homarus americanus TaxID=6706 RepID=UPI001C488B3F|nr:protein phosphatase 1 regulatory subunit 21-like isoform X2 [Homarus americanus]